MYQNRDIASSVLTHFGSENNMVQARFHSLQLSLSRLQGSAWALDSYQLYYARKCGIVTCLPSVLEDELNDQSKGNYIVKGLAIVQVSYVVLQLLVRYSQGLASSQLEIATVGFSACSILHTF